MVLAIFYWFHPESLLACKLEGWEGKNPKGSLFNIPSLGWKQSRHGREGTETRLEPDG